MNLRERDLDFVVDLAPLPAVPVAGTRKSFPVRRPCPHSAARTTRSRVCTGFTFSQAAPRRPAL